MYNISCVEVHGSHCRHQRWLQHLRSCSKVSSILRLHLEQRLVRSWNASLPSRHTARWAVYTKYPVANALTPPTSEKRNAASGKSDYRSTKQTCEKWGPPTPWSSTSSPILITHQHGKSLEYSTKNYRTPIENWQKLAALRPNATQIHQEVALQFPSSQRSLLWLTFRSTRLLLYYKCHVCSLFYIVTVHWWYCSETGLNKFILLYCVYFTIALWIQPTSTQHASTLCILFRFRWLIIFINA